MRVNRGGPESQKGTIISVCPDYFVLQNEKGELYYYQLKHLKSITKMRKNVDQVIASGKIAPVQKTLKNCLKVSNIAG